MGATDRDRGALLAEEDRRDLRKVLKRGMGTRITYRRRSRVVPGLSEGYYRPWNRNLGQSVLQFHLKFALTS